jgi:hypothetical protein
MIAFLTAWAVIYDRRFCLMGMPAFVGTLLVMCLPLLVLSMSGGLMQRAGEVALSGNDVGAGLIQFIVNYASHLDPRFLYWSGDTNLRHGTGGFGQLSWLDFFALLAGGWAFLIYRTRPKYQTLGLLSLAGVLTGAVAAALSSEGIPHALRANGMWPFLALGGAWLIAQVPSRLVVERAAVLVSAAFLLVFTYYFFVMYRETSKPYFNSELEVIALSEDPARWQTIATSAHPLVAGYYLMHFGGMRCNEAGEFISRARQ